MMQLSFFDSAIEAVKRLGRPKASGWELVDHACRHCSGRLLERVRADGVKVYRCCECEATEVGTHEALCWCGCDDPALGRVWECVRNERKTDVMPQAVLVRERVNISTGPSGARRLSPVRVEGF